MKRRVTAETVPNGVVSSTGLPNANSHNGKPSQFINPTLGVLLIMFISPNVVILTWYVVVHCDGSWLQLLDNLSSTGIVSGITRIWFDIHIASPISVGVIVGYMIWALLLMVVVPGPRVEGPVTPKGHIPVYRDNGFSCYVLTMFAFVVLAVLLPRYTPYSVTIVYDHFAEFLVTLNIMGHILCTFLYIKGLLWPSTTDCGTSGSLIFDYYWGTELYPRVLGVDIKVFTNCRFGMTVWPLLVAIFTLKNYELHGFVCSAWVSAILQFVYITKFFWWESGYMRTIDIMIDRAGIMICWGCIYVVPGFYTSVSLYLTNHPVQLGATQAVCILILGVLSCFVNYDADRQKLEVRRSDAQCTVWGREPEVIRAEYQTTDGSVRTSVLLVSGYWGIVRHFNYVAEVVTAFMWSLPAGFGHVLPYVYVLFLICLLMHRTYRDDDKCCEKYGKYWEEYCRRVPYKIIPYAF